MYESLEENYDVSKIKNIRKIFLVELQQSNLLKKDNFVPL